MGFGSMSRVFFLDSSNMLEGIATMKVGYSWYPTVRSTVDLTGSVSYTKLYADKKIDDIYMNTDSLQSNIGASWRFYISPKFSVSANTRYDLRYKKDHSIVTTDLHSQLYLAAGIEYSIF